MSDQPTPYEPAEGANFYRRCDLPADGTWEYRCHETNIWRVASGNNPSTVAFEARPIPTPPQPPAMVELPAEDVVKRLGTSTDPRRDIGRWGDDEANSAGQRLLDAAWAALDAADATP